MDVLVKLEEFSAFLELDGRIICAFSDSILSTDTAYTAWAEVEAEALALAVRTCSPDNTLSRLVTRLLSSRRNVRTWLVDELPNHEHPVAPLQPYDCVRPVHYVRTRDGWVPALITTPAPLNLDFEAYLSLLIKIQNAFNQDEYPVKNDTANQLAVILALL